MEKIFLGAIIHRVSHENKAAQWDKATGDEK